MQDLELTSQLFEEVASYLNELEFEELFALTNNGFELKKFELHSLIKDLQDELSFDDFETIYYFRRLIDDFENEFGGFDICDYYCFNDEGKFRLIYSKGMLEYMQQDIVDNLGLCDLWYTLEEQVENVRNFFKSKDLLLDTNVQFLLNKTKDILKLAAA